MTMTNTETLEHANRFEITNSSAVETTTTPTEASDRIAVVDQRAGQYPRGWYHVALAPELEAGKPLPIKVFGRKLILFRAADGTPQLVGRYCPHRGADFMLGEVKENSIACRLHNFCFSYNPNRPNKVGALPCYEANGSIYAWYAADGALPTWKPDTVIDPDEFYPWLGSVGDVRAAVQDLSEGVVDTDHFGCIHAEEVEGHAVSTDGHKLRVEYDMKIDHGWVRGLRYNVKLVETGPALTFGLATVKVPFLGELARSWINVSKTPIDENTTRVWGQVATPRPHPRTEQEILALVGPRHRSSAVSHQSTVHPRPLPEDVRRGRRVLRGSGVDRPQHGRRPVGGGPTGEAPREVVQPVRGVTLPIRGRLRP